MNTKSLNKLCKVFILIYTALHMNIQNLTNLGIPEGFGKRLREERLRLNLSQEELASSAQCKKLAQLQYESEARTPAISYLNLISAAGVDIAYLLLGIRFDQVKLSLEQDELIENKVFEWIDQCAKNEIDGKLSSETYMILFRLFKAYLTQVELGEIPSNFDPSLLVKINII